MYMQQGHTQHSSDMLAEHCTLVGSFMPFLSRAEMCRMYGIMGRPISNPGMSTQAVLEGKRREAMMLSQVVWEPPKIEDRGIAQSPKFFRIFQQSALTHNLLNFSLSGAYVVTPSLVSHRRISRPMLYPISDQIGCQSPSAVIIS